MIKLSQGFQITSKESIDSRLVLSKAQMKTYNENLLPDHYFALCSDDNKFYVFDKTNTKDPVLGKFRLFEVSVSVDDLALKLPSAIAKTMEDPTQAQAVADAMFDLEHFQVTLDNKIDLAISLIQAIGPNEEDK